MAIKSRTALKQDINDFLPENSQQEISATDLTNRLKDQADSVNFKVDNTASFGDGADTDKFIEANKGDVNNPKLRWNSAASKWQFTNDGTSYTDIGSGSAAIWGAITGTLSNQTDLNNALAGKEPVISPKNSAFNKNFDDATINLDGAGDLQVKDAGITHAKYQNIADKKLLGNFSGAAAPPSEIASNEEWLASGPASLSGTGEQGQKFANDFELWNCISANQWIKTALDRSDDIDLLDAAETAIGAAYADKFLVPQKAAIIITALAGSGINPQISLGNDAGRSNLVTNTALTSPAVGKLYELTLANNDIDLGTTPLYLKVGTAGTGYTTLQAKLLFKATLEG